MTKLVTTKKSRNGKRKHRFHRLINNSGRHKWNGIVWKIWHCRRTAAFALPSDTNGVDNNLWKFYRHSVTTAKDWWSEKTKNSEYIDLSRQNRSMVWCFFIYTYNICIFYAYSWMLFILVSSKKLLLCRCDIPIIFFLSLSLWDGIAVESYNKCKSLLDNS